MLTIEHNALDELCGGDTLGLRHLQETLFVGCGHGNVDLTSFLSPSGFFKAMWKVPPLSLMFSLFICA